MKGTGRVFKRGSIYWIAYCYRGKERRESSRSASEAQALKFLKKRIGEAATGKLIGPVEDGVTFEDLADALLITGPVTHNMRLALEKAYEAVPPPKIVIAVGACAISGGLFLGHPETLNGADGIVPVDLYIAGCPPHPITILDGLLRLIGRIEGSAGGSQAAIVPAQKKPAG